MPRRSFGIALLVCCVVGLGGACAGTIETPPGATGAAGASAGPPGAAGTASTGEAGVGAAPANTTSPVLPARVRRLTNAEYDASVQALLGTKQTLAVTTFPPDARQSGYTLNDAQRVDPVLAKQLAAAAQTLASEATASGALARLAPCADAQAGGAACARTFITSFGAAAYRRPLAPAEVDDLAALHAAGSQGGTYAEGLELVVRGVLQSAGFLYVTELGDSAAPAKAMFSLTPFETASALSYLVSAAPPDDELLAAARAGALGDGAAREQHARRLLAKPAAMARLVRVVREWLGIDGISATAKDTTIYPDFAGVRPSMDAESVGFITEVTRGGAGTVAELLGADWSVVDSPLAGVYGVTPGGSPRTSFAGVGRRGILNQGAFLSVYAHAGETAPVLRGVAVMRRVACLEVPSPTALNIVVTPPVPDPAKTTRQRFEIHATDKACAACHKAIDGLGFSFEGYDAMGRRRTMDAGHPVDSATVVATGRDFDGSYANSDELAAALANSADVRACVARHLFRASAGRSDASVAGAETAFLETWRAQPAALQGNLVETIVAYVRGAQFLSRRPTQ